MVLLVNSELRVENCVGVGGGKSTTVFHSASGMRETCWTEDTFEANRQRCIEALKRRLKEGTPPARYDTFELDEVANQCRGEALDHVIALTDLLEELEETPHSRHAILMVEDAAMWVTKAIAADQQLRDALVVEVPAT